MCGISGIINKNNLPVDLNSIRTINNLIIHRGPDDEGFYFGNTFAFGHRRLSIIDTSQMGHQPMSYLDKYWITYNGEIYNYIEIRDELINLGYNFFSFTDTEVILAAYDKWGTDCLRRFNGMWAFVIHDLEKNKLFFSRDRFGIKPLYYKENNSEFRFGSEIKQLLNIGGTNYLNENVLLEYMLTRFDDHTSETYFKDVFAFPPSHYMIYDLCSNTKSFHRYYEIKVDYSIRNRREDDLIKEFKSIFTNSISLRLRSDVIVGTCLSGGLDSSAISCLASKEYSKKSSEKFIAVNAKSTDQDNDESMYAKLVADKNNLALHVVAPSYQDFVKRMDEIIYTQEQPFGSPSMFMGWHVFEKAKNNGCKVMLNGQGGDEVLLGYERYFSSTLSLKRPLSFLKQIFVQTNNSKLTFIKAIAYYIYFRNAAIRIWKNKFRTMVVKRYFKCSYFNFIKTSAKSFRNPDELQILEITALQLPHLLRYEDRNSMRHSIETRLPFLDYRLVEFSISLPIQLKIKNGWTKYVLRKSIESELPQEITWRKNKFGFESPNSWIEKHSIQMLNDILESKIINHYCNLDAITRKYDKLSSWDKWLYFNIARWEKVFGVDL